MEYTERIISRIGTMPIKFDAECLAAAQGCRRTIHRNNDAVNFRAVLADIANGKLNELEHEIIQITASMGYVSENSLKAYLRLAGITFTSNDFDHAEEHLLRDQLIYVSNITSGDMMYKVYSVDNYGAQVAKKNGIYCKFEAFAVSEPASTVIKRAAISQLAAAYLTSSNPTALKIRPLLETEDYTVRPSLVIEMEGSRIIVEVVRRGEFWQSELLEKLNRLCAANEDGGSDTFLMFCGEDETMNREIYELMEAGTMEKPILFTEDKLLGNSDFTHSIYYFNSFEDTVTTEFADRVLKSEETTL